MVGLGGLVLQDESGNQAGLRNGCTSFPGFLAGRTIHLPVVATVGDRRWPEAVTVDTANPSPEVETASLPAQPTRFSPVRYLRYTDAGLVFVSARRPLE